MLCLIAHIKMISKISRYQFQSLESRAPWIIEESWKRRIKTTFGRKSLSDSIRICKYTCSDSIIHFEMFT